MLTPSPPRPQCLHLMLCSPMCRIGVCCIGVVPVIFETEDAGYSLGLLYLPSRCSFVPCLMQGKDSRCSPIV